MGHRIIHRAIVLGFLFLSSCFLGVASESPLTVEIEGIPSGYSVAYAGVKPILEARPALRLTSFKRLRFSSRHDEIALAIKTGNAPDILSLTAVEYHELASTGALLDLSSQLLQRSLDADGYASVAAWPPLHSAGEAMTSMMLEKGRAYAFPGRRRVHGVVVRRDLVDSSIPLDDLDVLRVARMATRLSLDMPTGQGYAGIAVPLDAERFLYWSIADYGRTMGNLHDEAAADGVAFAAVQNVYSSLRSLVHEPAVICDACEWVGTAGTAPDYAVCETCGADGVSLRVLRPAGRLVSSVDEGLDLFIEGRVGMVACTRSDLFALVDAGISPDQMTFVPLAGASYVPDVDRLALYARVPEREGGARRTGELIDFLKLYSSQFLAAQDSGVYLWYERAVISQMIRRGYGGIFSPAEVAACMEMPDLAGGGALVKDSMLTFSEMLPVAEFLEVSGLESVSEIDAMVSHLGQGSANALTALRQYRAARPSAILAKVVVTVLIAALLSAFYLVFIKGTLRRRLPVVTQCWPVWIVGFFVFTLAAFLLLKIAVPVFSSAFVASGLITGRASSAASIVEAIVALLSVTGATVFNALVAITFGVGLAMVVSMLMSRMDGWPAFMSFILVLPLTLTGAWGYMLLDALSGWGAEALGEGLQSNGVRFLFAARISAAAWATMPFGCMAYLYRLRRIDQGGSGALPVGVKGRQDYFFKVLLPTLEPAIKMHALILAGITICGAAPALMGIVDCGVGGSLLRAVLFAQDPWLVATLNAGALLAALLLAAIGLKWFSSLELRRTEPGSRT